MRHVPLDKHDKQAYTPSWQPAFYWWIALAVLVLVLRMMKGLCA